MARGSFKFERRVHRAAGCSSSPTALVTPAQGAGALVVLNDRADVARIAGADGVHVGQEDLAPEAVRSIVGPAAIVGLSSHTVKQIDRAVREPVSYVAIGPVFDTGTKATGYEAVGLDTRAVRRSTAKARGLPLVAIGGITLDRAPLVLDAGAQSVAVITDLLTHGDPTARVRRLSRDAGVDASESLSLVRDSLQCSRRRTVTRSESSRGRRCASRRRNTSRPWVVLNDGGAAVLKVALTGGIATGKSHVLARFQARGIPCLDADVLAHGTMAPGTEVSRAIAGGLATKSSTTTAASTDASLGRLSSRIEMHDAISKRSSTPLCGGRSRQVCGRSSESENTRSRSSISRSCTNGKARGLRPGDRHRVSARRAT